MTQAAQAVIVGGDVNGLGVLRSLGSGGVKACLLTDDPGDVALRSRYGDKRLIDALEGESLVRALEQLGVPGNEGPILFLTEERAVRAVSQYRSRVLAHCRIRLPEHDRLLALMHKQGFQEIAEQLGLPVPKTVRLRTLDDLASGARLHYPCVLKPALKDYGYGRRFKKAYVVNRPTDVERLFVEISPVLSDLVLQEWIEGDDSDIFFCLQYIGRDAKLVSSFSGQKVRSWPPRIGGTASCTAAWAEHDELSKLTWDFFRLAGFSGMGSMEFKRDRRDGRFYMVEPTVARTDFQQEVASVHGINIPLAAFRYEAGFEPTADRPLRRRVLWREPQTDRWSAQEQGAHPMFDQLPRCDAYFRWSDPGPALLRWGERAAAKIRNFAAAKATRPGETKGA